LFCIREGITNDARHLDVDWFSWVQNSEFGFMILYFKKPELL
jgi:hypothetical protein